MDWKKAISEFWRNEDGFGFLLPVLGTVAGGAIGSAVTAGVGGAVGAGVALGRAAGGLIGQGLLDRKNAKAQMAYDANAYVRMAEGARRAGLHPLEVLRAGDPGGASGSLKFGTSAAMQNQFDQIDAILTGEDAARRRREQLQDELLRVEIDQARAGSLRSAQRAGLVSPSLKAQAGIGAAPTMAEAESGETIVTNPGDIGSEFYVDPTRQDFAATEERTGDNEIINTPLIAEHWYNDWSYRQSLRFSAEQLGMTEAELHAKIIENPKLRHELPGLIAQGVMTAQKLFQMLKRQFGGAANVDVRGPKIASPAFIPYGYQSDPKGIQ